jgi:hypothetical protein
VDRVSLAYCQTVNASSSHDLNRLGGAGIDSAGSSLKAILPRLMNRIMSRLNEPDSGRIPNGFQADSQRIPGGFPTDSGRIPNGFRADSQRIPGGFQADSEACPPRRMVIEGGQKMTTGWEL